MQASPDNPHSAVYEPDLAMSLNNLSVDLVWAGRREEAEQIRSEFTEVEGRVIQRRAPSNMSV